MEPQNRQGVSLLEVLTLAFAVAVLILDNIQHIQALLVFVGIGHISLIFAIGVALESNGEAVGGRHTDVKLLVAATVLPISMSVLMLLVHNNVNFFTAANALYLLSLAFAVWAVAVDEPICAGSSCKVAGLAQVISALVSATVHIYIFKTHRYELQDALALFDIVPSFFAYLILISTFVVLSLKDTQKS
jgi:hypothetical protein